VPQCLPAAIPSIDNSITIFTIVPCCGHRTKLLVQQQQQKGLA
jgi:hypothetical protein